MSSMQRLRPHGHQARRRVGGGPAVICGAALAAAVVAGCGSSTPGRVSAPTSVAASSGAPGPCAGSGSSRAGVAVEVSPSRIVTRCVAFSGATIPALTLLRSSGIELGTQKFSFGEAICQVANVPDHYSKCLPSGQNYWAVFLSDGHTWTSPSKGVSQLSVNAGQWIGLRYDPPTGTPAPPPTAGPL